MTLFKEKETSMMCSGIIGFAYLGRTKKRECNPMKGSIKSRIERIVKRLLLLSDDNFNIFLFAQT